MNLTAQQVIEKAFRLIGVFGVGSTLTADEYQQGLLTANIMFDNWNIENLMIFSENINTFPFVNNQQVYTLGIGGNFNMARPPKIDRMSVQFGSPAMELPIDDGFSLDDWQDLTVKSTTSTFPTCCYNDTNYPVSNLSFWPIPTAPCNFIIYSWQSLPALVALTDIISIPPGYMGAIIYNLAILLAIEYDITPSQDVVAQAKQFKYNVASLNMETPEMIYDPIFTRGSEFASIAYQSRGRVII